MPSCLWPKVEVVVLTSPGALQIILNLRVRYTEKCRVPFWETLVFSKWTEGQEVSRDWGLLRIVKKKKKREKFLFSGQDHLWGWMLLCSLLGPAWSYLFIYSLIHSFAYPLNVCLLNVRHCSQCTLNGKDGARY